MAEKKRFDFRAASEKAALGAGSRWSVWGHDDRGGDILIEENESEGNFGFP